MKITDSRMDRKFCKDHCVTWHKKREICGRIYSAYLEGDECPFTEEQKIERIKDADKKRRT